MPRLARVFCSLLILVALGCATRGKVVEHHTLDLRPGMLEKVAIVPFYPSKGFKSRSGERSFSGKEAGDLVARFVSEALAARGIETIAPSDVVLAFEGSGQVLPRQDAKSTAALAASQFGATAVVVGSVHRYHEREGEALGSNNPASVWFEFAFYTAPEGKQVWTVRFDHKQLPLSADLFITRRYPGRGSRWLTAGELARWGAGEAVGELPEAVR
jgi:hypothetical protein